MADETVFDIAVSFDGTWAKRGHTSLFGIVFVISVDTGEVLDCHVLSKFCKSCSVWEAKRMMTYSSMLNGKLAIHQTVL